MVTTSWSSCGVMLRVCCSYSNKSYCTMQLLQSTLACLSSYSHLPTAISTRTALYEIYVASQSQESRYMIFSASTIDENKRTFIRDTSNGWVPLILIYLVLLCIVSHRMQCHIYCGMSYCFKCELKVVSQSSLCHVYVVKILNEFCVYIMSCLLFLMHETS